MITIAAPFHANIAAAIAKARRGDLRTVDLDTMTFGALKDFQVREPVIVQGCGQALSIIGKRNAIHWFNETEKV